MVGASRRRTAAALWHAATAVVAVFAVAAQLYLVVADVNIGFDDQPEPLDRRLVEFFSYFTIQSNVLVGIATGMLALNPGRDGALWRVARVASMFGITVTIVIYHVVLSPLAAFDGLAAVSNVALHYVVPILAIIGWLAFGPRDRIGCKTLLLSAIWPVAYLLYTLIHGAITGFYPLPVRERRPTRPRRRAAELRRSDAPARGRRRALLDARPAAVESRQSPRPNPCARALNRSPQDHAKDGVRELYGSPRGQ